MLILELKEGESFRINDDIEVNFKSIKASHVKVAIHAPDKLKIQRIEPPILRTTLNKAPVYSTPINAMQKGIIWCEAYNGCPINGYKSYT